MIYNLIGSGTLVAVGALVGGALVWADMRQRLAATRRRLHHSQDEADRLFDAWFDADEEAKAQRAIARLNGEAVQHWQAVAGNALEYCKQFRVRGAVVAGILSGEQDQ